MKYPENKNRGFTLIELVTVVGIIALLSTVVLSSLYESRQKARDTQRVQIARQVINALELYRTNNNGYPQRDLDNGDFPGALENDLSEFLAEISTDPTGLEWAYYTNSTFLNTFYGCGQAAGDPNVSYILSFPTEGTLGSNHKDLYTFGQPEQPGVIKCISG